VCIRGVLLAGGAGSLGRGEEGRGGFVGGADDGMVVRVLVMASASLETVMFTLLVALLRSGKEVRAHTHFPIRKARNAP
jgi:hypothetical protein